MNQPATTLPALRFPAGLVGFPDAHDFVLVDIDADAGVFELRSLADDGPRFVTVVPPAFFPDYAPEIDDPTVARLDLTEPQDALLLLVVTLGELAAESTANLMAPIVINSRTGEAAQAVLTGSGHPLRAPLAP